MSVLVDTSIWSLVLRRPSARLNEIQRQRVQVLEAITHRTEAIVVGVVQQELLSGLRYPAEYERLRLYLRSFPNEPISTDDFEAAAATSNWLQRRGIQASGVDCILCAMALARDWSIFSDDRDFTRYALVLPIRLYTASATPT